MLIRIKVKLFRYVDYVRLSKSNVTQTCRHIIYQMSSLMRTLLINKTYAPMRAHR